MYQLFNKGGFRLFDLDEDGFVSKPEMLYIVDAIYRMVGDTYFEGTPQDRVDRIFAEMDLDCDELLSFEEFLAGAQKDPLILNSLSLYSSLV
jgi:Ca2+-binding EF-hand superfamily protein